MFRKYFAIFLSLLFLATGQARALEPVDVELVLAVDCSYSVDQAEFRLQMDGLAAAFSSAEVIKAILEGSERAIAVSVVQWSKSDVQIQAIGWTRLGDMASILQFSNRLRQSRRLSSDGGTSISGAIAFSHLLIENNAYEGRRKIVDISGDGRNNSGRNLSAARAYALARGLTINGLTILNEVPTLHYYFRQKVIGGPGAFVEIANDYAGYPKAILKKLLREIRPAPISEKPQSAPKIMQASIRR